MKIERCTKKSFTVIGKEGSTMDGAGFIQKLWEDANSHFNEVEGLAKRDKNANFVGFWGAMSDLSHSFRPWEDNFSKGLYLAGVECADDVETPEGWVKWIIPGYECFSCHIASHFAVNSVLTYRLIGDILIIS